MGKTAGKKLGSIEEFEKSLASFNAKKQFITASLNMGWQLALTILVPVIVGVKLDDRFNSEPSYTLAALVLAAGGASMVVANTLKQAAREQSTKKKAKNK